MPYIILSANDEEVDRRELTGPLVIGRAQDCGLSVHDILLSRHHCRLEPAGKGWRLEDLKSKNGTRLGWTKISKHLLVEGDRLRIGRTILTFHAGPFVPAPADASRRSKLIRPADPHEALTGTVAGFTFVEPEPPADPHDRVDDAVVPSPAIPVSGKMLIAGQDDPSSSWDSMVATMPKTKRRLARPIPLPAEVVEAGASSAKYRQAVADLSLQVGPQHLQVSSPPEEKIPLLTVQDIKMLLLILAGCLAAMLVWLAASIQLAG